MLFKKMLSFSLASFIAIGALVSFALKPLDYYYGNDDKIGYCIGRNIYHLVIDGYSFSDFNSYKDHARSQWASAGINTTTVDNKYNSNIEIYGGNRNSLELINPQLKNFDAICDHISKENIGWAMYGNRNKAVYVIHRAMILVPKKGFFTSDDTYKNMFTHELGHALGWMDHSTSSSDVMYSAPSSSRTILTNRDKQHLSQMY